MGWAKPKVEGLIPKEKKRNSKTYCDQSVHNIFTGLQAGSTRHLQEQFFGRLPDLQSGIYNVKICLLY